MHNSLRFGVFLYVIAVSVTASLASGGSAISFNRDIRPILADKCFACHGPDAEGRQADLRLDQSGGPDGAYAFAIQPGSVEESELWHRIISDDEDEQMPPPDSHKTPLSEHERQLFKQWIEAGANYESFWAFRTPQLPTLPAAEDTTWSDQPIDLFVLRKLRSNGLEPAAEADPRTLIRRLTFDLTGLPPTRDEIHRFLAEASRAKEQGSNGAFKDSWERLVDDLLARPQFGEHMARYWLDLVRFADTNGMHKDFYRNHVAYRDWVIRSFNDNLAYDDFVRFQLAGDLFDQPTRDQLIASGFHRLHLIIDVGTALPEESFHKNVIDRLTSVGTAFMGMTVHCAQCHDHKYDPITQKDFYSLYAFFNNIDAKPETVRLPDKGLQPPFIFLGTADQQEQLAELDRRISELDQRIEVTQKELKQSESAASATSGKDSLSAAVQQLEAERKMLQTKRKDFNREIPYAMVMKERNEVRPTHMLVRGQYDAPGEPVTRGTPAFLPPLKTSGEIATRMDLANWFVDASHPLTARVAVNRVWQQFFGVGLVKTSEDLGAQGDVPSHPDLLEHLTVLFVESGWNVKSLVKQIVMSKTYRQSSLATTEQFEGDPDNRLLARGSRFRLDAEMIRDQVLFTSGLLSEKMFGPSVKPPQPDGLWKAVTMTGQVFRPDTGSATVRRSLYTFWKRAMPPPQMTILNAPTRAACIARRERTNTPSQALLLLNETEYFKAARALAARTLQQETDRRIEFIWETVTGRLPDESERETLRSLVADLTDQYREDLDLCDSVCGDSSYTPEAARPELAAWTVVGNTLYNLDIVKTRD